ncbi:MAG: molybdopterin converting factor subunit 1 [Thermomicrobiales bacterium]
MTSQPAITIRLRFFAILREQLGRSEQALDVPLGTTTGEAFLLATTDQPRLAGLRRSMMLMVNEEYVRGDHVLQDGDELAFIPPVSGGEVVLPKLFVVTAEELEPRAVEALVAADDSGAIVTFTGTVRNNARNRDVIALDYEAYVPAAERQLGNIGIEIVERWPSVRTAIHHRTGYLVPGVASVIIACASPHRAEAFAAASHAIERIKVIVPIWKKEHYADGSVWIGSEADYQAEVKGNS